MRERTPTIQAIVRSYNMLVQNIDSDARGDAYGRAYGGVVRAAKGKLVEGVAHHLVQIAWKKLGGAPSRLNFERNPILVPIRRSYIERIQHPEVQAYILQNIKRCVYRFRTDIHVHVDGNFVLGVECKAYAENAMLKRIMVDCMFLKQAHPNAAAVLLQLESQLGGDYGDLTKKVTLGSYPTHTIMSYFDVVLNIVTLLEGERKVNKPIHQKAFRKELQSSSLTHAVGVFAELLRGSL